MTVDGAGKVGHHKAMAMPPHPQPSSRAGPPGYRRATCASTLVLRFSRFLPSATSILTSES